MRTTASDFGICLSCCIRKLENQDVVRGLVGLAVPSLRRILSIGCLCQLLKHVFAAFQYTAGGPVFDGLESLDVRCAPISYS